jgi:hypothetical protein
MYAPAECASLINACCRAAVVFLNMGTHLVQCYFYNSKDPNYQSHES